MSFQPALGQSRAAVPSARLRAVLGSLVLLTMVLVPLGSSSVAVAAPAGVDWTSRTSAADNDWFSVTYGGGLFVAVSETGSGNRVMTSPDGITWTSRTSASNNPWFSVTYGGGLFVAVSYSGTGNRVMTSPDGITWTSQTAASSNSWLSVTYGGGLFVAVSSSGTDNRVMTSPDGITWTSRTSAADNPWSSVTYGGGLFVAVSYSGTGNRVMTSPDGIIWTIRTSAADNDWVSVTYGNGLFVAVSRTAGTGNQVMTSVWSATAPGAPVITGATAGQTSAAVAFTADDSGGSTITRLEFALDDTTAVDDSTTSLSSPYTLSNLSLGTAYTVYMRAVNAVGAGPWSAPRSFTTLDVPGVPVITGVSPGETSAAVAFTADDSGGSTITRLEFALDDTTAVDDSTTSLSSPYTLSNLSLGTAYTVYMRAVNAVGSGPWSAPQGFVTSSPPIPPPVYPPGAPTGAMAVAGDASASVSWVAPSDSGSYPISTYQVTSAPGGRSCLVAVPALTCTVSGLTNGTAYTFTVRALNGAGWGASSGPSNAVTPRATPVKTIQITGSRDALDTRIVRVSGTTTGLVGEQVAPWVRFTGQTTFTQGSGVRTVAADGTFAWARVTGEGAREKQVHVYFTHVSIKSNTVVIPAR